MSLFDTEELFFTGRYGRIYFHPEDADLVLINSFFSKEDADRLYNNLLEKTQWQQSQISIYGKVHVTPRLTAWYGDGHKSYQFSGNKLEPFPWTKDLLFIKLKVEEETGIYFNSVLLNLYRNGPDSVGWHRDNEKEFGKNPVIASVSFGETRSFQLRHKFKKHIEKLSIPLTHGSLLIMNGSTQHFWEHQVPKTSKPVSPRINLTFRIIKTVNKII